jgi:hypothetical protein
VCAPEAPPACPEGQEEISDEDGPPTCHVRCFESARCPRIASMHRIPKSPSLGSVVYTARARPAAPTTRRVSKGRCVTDPADPSRRSCRLAQPFPSIFPE